jgi:signal transduction histidine kinase
VQQRHHTSLEEQACPVGEQPRDVVYGLRPPALDDLGLVGAIRQQVERAGAPGLQVSFDVPDELPDLPAAVEVAALRIVSEAVTNVVRHSGARCCTISLTCPRGGPLAVSVSDDGSGIDPGVAAGERAGERAGEGGRHVG